MILIKLCFVFVTVKSSFGSYGTRYNNNYGATYPAATDVQSDVNAPSYIPPYLKYGNTGGHSSHSGYGYSSGVKTSGVKTSGVKTSGVKTSGAHNAPYTVGNMGAACPYIPIAPINGAVRCQFRSSCKFECMPGHQFPNGNTARSMYCKDGNWVMEWEQYPPNLPCEPICLPACQNNGICVAPGECQCPETFSGPQCQHENKPCLNYPPLSMNSKRQCSSDFCTITCADKHQFPDGTSLANLMCRNGQWVPSRADWVTIPDCKPMCDPPCQNGGACLSLNTCQCPQDFRGPQCQYSTSACSVSKLNFNGGYKCTGDSDSFSCQLNCPSMTRFTSPPAQLYTCLYSTGVFEPQPIPQCDTGSNVIITHGGSSQSIYHHGSSHSQHGDDVEIISVGGTYGAVSRKPHYMKNESNILINSETGYYGSKAHNQVTVLTPRPGVCFTWGGAHYKTFDGQVYSFQSPCRHTLVRDSAEHTFKVVVKHGGCKDNAPCPSQISIFLQEKEYIISKGDDGGIIFRTIKRLLPIPATLPGLRVSLVAHNVVAELSFVGATIKWDTHQLVQVEASESLWNRTEGLCGVLDGRADTDILTKDRQRPKTIATLADSWQLRQIGEICESSPTEQNACSKQTTVMADMAEKFCKKLINKSKFQKCAKIMPIESLLEACRWDYCGCPPEEDPEERACSSLSVYSELCVLGGVDELKRWRDDDTCPMRCTDGKIYNPCGPEVQQTCGRATASSASAPESCTEGCFCRDGMFLNEGKCVTKQDCPCLLRNRSFKPGSVVSKGCNTCKCEAGEWTCTELSCSARCGAIGDPHYTTFDGKHYDFMGKCSYHLLKGDNYSVDVQNVECAGAISEAMNLVRTVKTGGTPSCTKAVTIYYDNAVIKLKQRGTVTANGNDVTSLPARVNDIIIRTISSLFLIVELPNGVDISWDGLTRVFVDVPGSFRDQTKGLCGTFNHNQKDDFLTPEGDVEQSVPAFVNKWKTREMCDDVELGNEPLDPCRVNAQNKPTAEKHCNKLKSKLFEDCHWFVDVEPYYEDCMFDMCACEGQVSDCLCDILGAYATECASQGVKIDWRLQVEECEPHCTGGQFYQVCADSCTRTCSDVSHNFLTPLKSSKRQKCEPRCVEGCACANQEALDANGECVPVASCPCHHDGLEFPAGYKEVRPGKKGNQMLCKCNAGKWLCRQATPEEILQHPRASDIKDKCSADANLEFTTCEHAEPLTCKNMHLLQSSSTAECKPGCECKKGYVLETVSKKCILAVDCPCHHGGQSYQDGHKRPEECNTCECKKGKWECTERQCNGVCNAWGDSHFTTFDGKNFDFQGVCTYLLAQGMEADNIFTVEIQNEACGTTGATCAKSIILKVGNGAKEETVALTKHNPLPDVSALDKIKLREAGAFVFLDVLSLGVTLQWDKATRVYVKVDPKWKGRVAGLCGNYNGDVRDDFQTPSGGGMAEASPLLFADSWRLSQSCPQAAAVQDYCEERQFRKEWATSTCGVINRPPFTQCHSEVPPAEYVQRCEKDACACDSGGDCECVCIALATYSQLCAARGIIFKWRSKELCPCQCDEENTTYDPCVSACPQETCENTLDYDGVKKSCQEDVCVEGCKLKKTCPQGTVFSNSTLSTCVPRTTCKPPCMTLEDGRVVLEGEVLEEDACHTCRCSRKQRVCTGLPCPTVPQAIDFTTTSTTTTAPKELPSTPPPTEGVDSTSPTTHKISTCKTGWSQWVNRHKPSVRTINGQEITLETEQLPIINDLANTEDLGTCGVDMITDIECRTVGEHKSILETNPDAGCSLDRGLLCRSTGLNKCPDFEIRVFCQCDESAIPPVIPHKFPQCLDAIRPNHEHPTDCHKFYQCVPGSGPPEHPDLVLKTCAELWYNPVSMICDWPDSVRLIRPECDGPTPNPLSITDAPLTTSKPVYSPTTTTTAKTTPVTTFVIDTTTESPCPIGQVWSDCALPCKKLCHGYLAQVKKHGKCLSGKICEVGCIPEEVANKKCDSTSFWRDLTTCVPKRDCTCAASNGDIVRPGGTKEEAQCVICQCHDNAYSCDESECIRVDDKGRESKPTAKPVNHVLKPPVYSTTPSPPPILVVTSTATPLPECDANRFKYLLWDGELAHSAFTASSVAGSAFAPHNAVLDGHSFDVSAGSWTPQVSDKNQFIQVEFPRREPIYGVIMQGSPIYDQYVSSYEVMYGDDGWTFSYIEGPDQAPAVFAGPTNNREAKKQLFEHPIEAKYLRVKPRTWHEDIAVRFEVIGCSFEDATTTPRLLTTKEELPQCEEPMTFTQKEGHLPLSNIMVSSEHVSGPKKFLDISQDNAWRPIFSTPGEWIFFDFTGLRNITGIVTKGGKTGWVKSYTVRYSPDKESWSPITDDDGNDRVFPANFDSEHPVMNMFTRPIHMRYLKVLPAEWKDNIEMRIEPLGCFLPYPPMAEEPDKVYTIPPGPTSPTPGCQLCPGLVSPPTDCNCAPPKVYFDGEACTTAALCPCFVGLISYQVGATFKSSNCDECACKMGGVADCLPTKCPPCAPNLISKKSPSCDCLCEPCPQGERTCPTSQVCVPNEKWCDGVTDCPDDEVSCSTTAAPQFTTTLSPATTLSTTVKPTTLKPEKKCPVPNCAPGYKVKLMKPQRSPYEKYQSASDAPLPQDSLLLLPPPRPRKTYQRYFKGVKGGASPMYTGTKTRYVGTKSSAFTLSKPTNQVQNTQPSEAVKECELFKCISDRPLPALVPPGHPTPPPEPCPVPVCPPHYKLKVDHMVKSVEACPKYSCEPPPPRDVVCNVTGRTFNTFDGIEYKYDICDHLLARDADGDKWSVIIQKNCTQSAGCAREILIKQDGDQVRFLPTLQVEYNGFPYTVDQTKKIGLDRQTFLLSRIGNVMLYLSKKYGFWVSYNTRGDVKIGVPHRLSGVVDGLCGFFDGAPENDRRMPDGRQVVSTELFGNSWSRPDLPPNACEARQCPLDLQAKAWDMCSVIYERSLSVCGKVMDLQKWRTRCLERVCECAQTSPTVKQDVQECLCEALQSFVVECQSADRTIDLQGWRSEVKCPAECPAPLVHHDCYRRACEPGCSPLLAGAEQCPSTSGVCFPGCFCPEGKLRKGDECVSPQECRDCVCDGVGSPAKYTTFEREELPFSGNCTYIAARDKSNNNQYKFQVFVTNGACENDQRAVCAEAVHVIYEAHVLHVQKNTATMKVDVSMDGKPIYKTLKTDWLSLSMQPGKEVSIVIPDAQLEVTSLFKSMAFSVRVPSYVYANKTEGLCGNCGGFDEELVMENGTTTTDVQEYGLSWLVGKPVLDELEISIEKNCLEKPKNECLPLPPDQDPCFKILDDQKFGICHPVVDPVMYITACQQDLCQTGRQVGVCSSLERYATECRRAGLCVDWRSSDLCPYPCSGPFNYQPCALGCTLTCDNHDELSANPKNCDQPAAEGCFCPDGKVLLNNTCIEHTKCFPCDAEHYAGDEWEVDACTKCSCSKLEKENAAHVSCTKQSCTTPVCSVGEVSEKLPTKPMQCCPEFICVPQATVGPQCDEPQTMSCGFGQDLQLETTPNGCKQFSCKCKPPSECPLVPNENDIEDLEPGMERLIDRSGCCPKAELTCKPASCPQPPACPQFKELKTNNATGRCCPEYECVLPDKKCLVTLEWEAAAKGGEKRKPIPQTLLKLEGETWSEGPCRSCVCQRLQTGPSSQCSVTDCPNIVSTEDMVVEPLHTPHTCCPVPKYVACKHNERIFKIGEKWTPADKPCQSFECVEMDGRLEKHTTIKQCDDKCKPGWEYKLPAADECCGECKEVACVVNGTQHNIGDKWASADHCTEYVCEASGGTLQVRSASVVCPVAPASLKEQFELRVTPIAGNCCSTIEPIACKVKGVVYQEGSTWPTQDPCKNVTCARDASHHLAHVESVQSCPQECPRGQTYRPAIDTDTCCGQCEQTSCIDGDELRAPDSTWQSANNCTTSMCSRLDGQLSITRHQESCPDVSDCPVQNRYTLGCCQHCNQTALSQSTCGAEDLPAADTIGLIKVTRRKNVHCVNNEPIVGFKECQGGCSSGTVFNKITSGHDVRCTCCQPTAYNSIVVNMHCSDGRSWQHQVSVPTVCSCEPCKEEYLTLDTRFGPPK